MKTQNQLRIEVNPVYKPLLNDRTEILLLYGGSGSGKSYFAHQKVLLRILTEKGHKILALRKVDKTLKESIYPLFRSLIYEWQLEHEFEFNKTEKNIFHLPTGNEIVCRGLDEPEKIKSIHGITSILYDELTEFTFDDFTQTMLRVRGEKDNYVQFIGCFNPISEYHWLKRNIIDNIDELNAGGTKYKYVHTTYKDNLFLTERDVKTITDLQLTNKLYYDIYALGIWGVEDKSGKFCFAFDEERHSKHCEYNPNEYLYLSFDFNKNPITCAAIQHYNETIYVPYVFKLHNSNIYSLCDAILAKYPNAIYSVTGDATGKSSSAMVQDNLNYYKVIKSKLNLSTSQLFVPTINPPITENKVLVNALLENYSIKIDPVNSSSLIYDMKFVEVDEDNKIIKDRSTESRKADVLDCFRYYCNQWHKNFLKFQK